MLILAAALGFRPQPPTVSASNRLDSTAPVEAVPDSLASTSTYFIVRRDVRRCASPLCGGYFVSRVNRPRTRCPDGRNMNECYVAEIEWNGHTEAQGQRTLVRGDLLSKFYRRFGQLGVLRVTETWEAGSGNAPTGEFFRVTDRGLRCITHPCLTHHEAKLNMTASREIAGAELNGTGATESRIGEALAAMTGPGGILVSGSHRVVTGPGGRAQTLQASQFYLRAAGWAVKKPCIKTGCSKQVCSDKEEITTCEYRSEYDCYKRAACERQANGECGFTMTPQLRTCLNTRRNP
jgi:uncharacterized protein DUF6748